MNATDYLMFLVVFIGNNLSFVSSRFNMCNKFISIRFAINIEPVRLSTSNDFLILAHCVFEFDTPVIEDTQTADLDFRKLLNFRLTFLTVSIALDS